MLWVTGAKLCPLIQFSTETETKDGYTRDDVRGRGIRTYLVESLKGELLFVKRILKKKLKMTSFRMLPQSLRSLNL